MTPEKLRELFPNASEEFIRRNAQNPVAQPVASSPVPRGSQSPVIECAVCDESVGAASGEAKNSTRYIVRIQSLRCQLCDPDNIVGGTKYFCDALRYLGLIPGDEEAVLSLHVSQTKVKTKEEETTLIEIIPPWCQKNN